MVDERIPAGLSNRTRVNCQSRAPVRRFSFAIKEFYALCTVSGYAFEPMSAASVAPEVTVRN